MENKKVDNVILYIYYELKKGGISRKEICEKFRIKHSLFLSKIREIREYLARFHPNCTIHYSVEEKIFYLVDNNKVDTNL